MGHPGPSTKPGSLENFEDCELFPSLSSTFWDIGDYFDYGHETASESRVRADESRADPPSGQNDNSLSPSWPEGTCNELGKDSLEDGLCKGTILDGKCNCPACSKKSFDKDLRELVNFDFPDTPHVFAFHMPPDGASGQLVEKPFSSNMSLLQPAPGSSQNRHRPINCELSRNKNGKRRKIREKSSESNVLKFMTDILQTNGDISAAELLARVKQSVEIEEGLNHLNPTEPSSHQQETNFARSSSQSAASFIEASRTRNGLQLRHNQTSFGSSSASCAPRRSMTRSIDEPFPSDFDFRTASQSQTAVSVCSGPSSPSYDFKTINTGLVGPHRARHSTSTLYQCTFKSCDGMFWSKSDWKRHETSVHKQRYMCMECGAGLADSRGGYACGLCFASPFASLDAVKTHTVQCEEARKVGKSFTRKDNLRNHLREDHDQPKPSEDAFQWVFDVNSDWTLQCGFCGDALNDWDLRANHIELHFMNGERISTWKVPFPRPGDTKQQSPNNDPEDDEENDDDDDLDNGFDDSKGSGAIRGFNKSYLVAKDTNNQDASSAMMWSCRNHTRESVQELDGINSNNWDLEIEDNESESTYTQPTVRELVDPTTSTGSVFHVIFSPLETYLSDHEQHEHLVLGLKRRPLNIIIGAKDHRELMEAPPQRQKSAATQSSEPSSPPHGQNRASSSKPSDRSDPSTLLPASTTAPKPAINYEFLDQQITDTPISDRIRYLFLERSEAYIPGYHSQTVTAANDHAIKPQAPYPQTPTDSTVSTLSSVNGSLSHQTSISTVASAIPVPPPWDSETLNQHIASLPYDYGYDLPCEFGFIGCNLRFHPEHFEAWIDHTISHFLPGISPPLKSICIFCDTEFDCTTSPLDARSIWRDRMLHINSHFEARVPSNCRRPDFFVIEHMHTNGLISLKDYMEAREYTERPHCNGLVPPAFQTEDMKRKKEKELQRVDDLEKEERIRRKETRRNRGKGKGKGKDYEPSRKSRPVNDKYGSFQAIPLTTEESGVPERKADLNQSHGEYEKGYRDDSSQEKELMLLTEDHGIKIQGNDLAEDSEKTNTTPVWAQEPVASTDPSYPPSLKGPLSSASTTSSQAGYPPPFQKKGYADSPRCHGKLDRIHSRVSSLYWHETYCNGLSTGQELYTSGKSRTGYHARRYRKYRTPDNERKYISATSSGAVEVIAHGKGSLDFYEPRASDATPSQYEMSQHFSHRTRP